ncbi:MULTISPECIES: hypothetical protein [Cyclobacteriaceae]|uniref:Uncharacterized protein n=2 Tax=Cyclobacteriaceae TaxID=563798 RepID=K1L3C4_CECL9|nr:MULTISPECIES: hypothetical protein [Cecembia]EKB49306.1 hypothetical protein B879_02061 [Cecembia lonarensis LW9]
MITKEKVLETLKTMPNEFSIDDLMDKLILLNKVQVGMEQAKKGDSYTSDQAKKLIKEWSK